MHDAEIRDVRAYKEPGKGPARRKTQRAPPGRGSTFIFLRHFRSERSSLKAWKPSRDLADKTKENSADQTNGTLIEKDPQKWADAIETLMRARRAPTLENRGALPVRFEGDLSALPARKCEEVAEWNHAWVKESATMLAEGE